MNYITHVNSLIRSTVASQKLLVMFGQNIAAGSCISGLTRGLKSGNGHFVLNTPNCENTLVGAGFGMMLNGVSSIFFMKQQDFLLLGIDQLVNTYNLIRRRNKNSSFTVFNVVVDSGYEGPQSSLNNFYDFCSFARIQGYGMTNKHDCEKIISAHLVSPGFRILGVSQRLFRAESFEVDSEVLSDRNGEIFQYKQGSDATIVCFNFSFPQGFSLWKDARAAGLETSLFSVNAMHPVDWSRIIKDARKTGKLVVLDDSKSVNKPSLGLILEAGKAVRDIKTIALMRNMTDEDIRPCPDRFEIDNRKVIEGLSVGLRTPIGQVAGE